MEWEFLRDTHSFRYHLRDSVRIRRVSLEDRERGRNVSNGSTTVASHIVAGTVRKLFTTERLRTLAPKRGILNPVVMLREDLPHAEHCSDMSTPRATAALTTCCFCELSGDFPYPRERPREAMFDIVHSRVGNKRAISGTIARASSNHSAVKFSLEEFEVTLHIAQLSDTCSVKRISLDVDLGARQGNRDRCIIW